MSHLNASEIVDAVDGALAPGRQAHARECARCRGEIERASVTLADVRSVDAPEPSPLFWDHFATRVREAIAADRPRRPWGLTGRWVWGPLTAAAVLAIAAGVTVGNRGASHVARPHVVRPHVARPHVAPSHVEAPDDPWTLVTDVADGIEWDEVEAAGFAVRPGAAEHALLQLSDEQQQELARLLEEEIDRLRSRG